MIGSIIDWSVNHRLFVCCLTSILVFLGWKSMQHIPLDALPDLSDTQVIVHITWDVSADILEDQLTAPLVTSLLSLPQVRDIRALSTFGAAWIYVIFEDDVDIYWARSRLSEYLNTISNPLPQEAQIKLGPDATGVGWIYQYVLVDRKHQHALHQLRSLQENHLKLHLQAIPGVAEVASFGGYEKQLEVQVDPDKLQQYGLKMSQVMRAVQESHGERGARVMEFSGSRYMIRLRGYVKTRKDVEQSAVHVTKEGVPILVKDLAHVSLSPQPRHGVGDFNGLGDAVGGVVVMRHGGDVYAVTRAIESTLNRLQRSLPQGVEVVETYNRNHLISRSMENITTKLLFELLVVSLIVLVFLLHFPSALVPIICLPSAIIISMILVYYAGVTINIMTLGGIAIAMGAMVDAALVMIENCHKYFLSNQEISGQKSRIKIIAQSMKEVAPSSFYSLMIVALSFLPIFFLERQEGRLFQPLAYSKTCAMLVAAFLSITFVPSLCALFLGREPRYKAGFGGSLFSFKSLKSEEDHPITRFLYRVYSPALLAVIRHRKKVVLTSIIMVLLSIPLYMKLGSEFMPAFNEGTILYMPTTMPGISLKEAQSILRQQDKILMDFPEVISVHGKAGRAATATDPAPLSMFETVILLKDQRQWRERERWYSALPQLLHAPFEIFQSKHMSYDELIAEMDEKMQFPGFLNAWTQPIKGRIDMLTTGIRTPVGIRISGADLAVIEGMARDLEVKLSDVPGTRSAYAERIGEGHYLDVNFDRELLARHGLSLAGAQRQLSEAISGKKVGEVIVQRDRYPLVVRYDRSHRDSKESMQRVLLDVPLGYSVALSEVASVTYSRGPATIKNENGHLVGYVFLDLSTSDIGDYVKRVQDIIANDVEIPAGYDLDIVGQYESMQRVNEQLKIVIPLVLFVILMMIYLNLKSVMKTLIVATAIPFSLIGAIGLVYLLDYQLSIAVWVGMVALIGVDIETAMFMLLYLDMSYDSMKKNGKMRNFNDLQEALHGGAAKRLRPKFMMVLTTILALLPILLGSSADSGADVMKRMVAPMIGGMVTSFILELMIYPALYAIWKERHLDERPSL